MNLRESKGVHGRSGREERGKWCDCIIISKKDKKQKKKKAKMRLLLSGLMRAEKSEFEPAMPSNKEMQNIKARRLYI